jgi:hypothetical protein
MREFIKEWLLRKLVAELMRHGFFVHLFTVIFEEHLTLFNEDGMEATTGHMHYLVDLARERVVKSGYRPGDPML